MTKYELNEVLRKHKLWLEGEDGGERADMQCADMQRAKMQCANMQDAYMQCAKMQCANMQDAYMQCANMQYANMRGAQMQRADMQRAKMQCANMQDAYMQCANMQYANMQCAQMQGADMRDAQMRGADMRGANIDYSAWPLWCGSLHAYIDDRIAIQLLYHTLSAALGSPYTSERVKKELSKVVGLANEFHRVKECGKLAPFVWDEKE